MTVKRLSFMEGVKLTNPKIYLKQIRFKMYYSCINMNSMKYSHWHSGTEPFQTPPEVHNNEAEPAITNPKWHWKLTRSPKWKESCVVKMMPFSGACRGGHITGTHVLLYWNVSPSFTPLSDLSIEKPAVPFLLKSSYPTLHTQA